MTLSPLVYQYYEIPGASSIAIMKKQDFFMSRAGYDDWGTLASDRINRWVSAGVPVVLMR
jgi:hypothetical protein